uniref:Uncharacterized protein n=1 Tax=Spongospora subterranea TaxID=70186 RepID=A0A0H5QPI2_9EUKA|eukprot:CRZ03497.1 hypothetical protein [Spongospora subterranea]
MSSDDLAFIIVVGILIVAIPGYIIKILNRCGPVDKAPMGSAAALNCATSRVISSVNLSHGTTSGRRWRRVMNLPEEGTQTVIGRNRGRFLHAVARHDEALLKAAKNPTP